MEIDLLDFPSFSGATAVSGVLRRTLEDGTEETVDVTGSVVGTSPPVVRLDLATFIADPPELGEWAVRFKVGGQHVPSGNPGTLYVTE